MSTSPQSRGDAGSRAPAGLRRHLIALYRIFLNRASYVYSLVLLIILWEAVARSGLTHPVFLPAFSSVVEKAGELLKQGELFEPLAVSLFRAFVGLSLSIVFGVILGILMARSRSIHWIIDPFVSLGFPAPKIAFIPVFILWFGIGHLSKILLVSFACIFPIIIAMYQGAKEVNRSILWSALAMGTSQGRLLWRIMLPACLPHLFAAVRIVVPVALITTFTAEMVSGGGGVGDDLMYAQRLFDTATVFVYIIIMLAAGLAFDWAILLVRRRVLRWHAEDGGRR